MAVAGLAAAFAGLAVAGAPPARAASPAVNYALNCQGCHLADGREIPDLVPALRGSVGRFARVPAGRDYLIRLPNVASTSLSDADTALLLNWVVERFADPGPDGDEFVFAAFTAEEVAGGRRRPLLDVDGARRAALRQVESREESATR